MLKSTIKCKYCNQPFEDLIEIQRHICNQRFIWEMRIRKKKVEDNRREYERRLLKSKKLKPKDLNSIKSY